MPRDTSTRPGAPRTMLGLFDPCTATSAHESSSRPFSTSMSARRSFSMRLGRISSSWAFCVPRASDSTSTSLPPTSSVSALRSGIVATTRILSAAEAVGSSGPMPQRAARKIRIARRMDRLLEGVRRMGAEDERALEEDLVHPPGARVVQVEGVASLRAAVGVLVRQPEAQELRRPEREIRLDRPLLTGIHRVLRPVVADAAGPTAEGLHLEPGVPAEVIALTLVDLIDRAVPVHVDADVRLAQRVERFARDRDQWMEPTVRTIFVAALPAQDRGAVSVVRLAARDRHAQLDRVLVAELEERPEPAGGEGVLQGAAAEGGLVVPVEDAGERLDVEGQVGDERQFKPLFLQPLAAQEVAHDVGPIDPWQIVLVHLVRVAETVSHLTEASLGAKGEREHGDVGLGQVHACVSPARFFSRFDPDDRGGVGIDLTEEGQLDLAREEPVLLPREGSAPGPLDVALRDVADEVAGDTHVEQELARAPLLIEGVGLAWAQEVDRRRRRCRGWRGGA